MMTRKITISTMITTTKIKKIMMTAKKMMMTAKKMMTALLQQSTSTEL